MKPASSGRFLCPERDGVKQPDMSKPRTTKQQGRKAEAKPEAFDLWLQRGLHKIYDTVAKEPIPDEWLKLIEEDREK